MTKQQMTDTILFALDELGKARDQLNKLPMAIEACPVRAPHDGELSATAYTLGRTEGAVDQAKMWLNFGITTLEQCVKTELGIADVSVRMGAD